MSEVTKSERAREPAKRKEPNDALMPPVDIFEQSNALHVIADMPGVTSESLGIEVDNNILTLEGDVKLDMPEGLSAIYAEVRAQRFMRRFTLSHEIQADAIEASIENGVVHLVLPKKETHRARRIEVKTA